MRFHWHHDRFAQAVDQGFRQAEEESRRHENSKYLRMRALQRPEDVERELIEGVCRDVTEGGVR